MSEERTEPAQAREAGFWTKFRADLARKGEQRTGVIWYLIVEKGIQGLIFMALGIVLLIERREISGFARNLIDHYELDLGRGFATRMADAILVGLGGTSATRITVIAVGAIFHATLELVEAVGLFLQRRWAEYLVVLATGFLIPVEINSILGELTHPRPSMLWKLAVTALNIAIIVYLIRRKRLFRFDLPEAQPEP
jgi:uncharacterized membrane protein (DUF2068 family)